MARYGQLWTPKTSENHHFSRRIVFTLLMGFADVFRPQVLSQTPQKALFYPRSYSKGPNHALEEVHLRVFGASVAHDLSVRRKEDRKSKRKNARMNEKKRNKVGRLDAWTWKRAERDQEQLCKFTATNARKPASEMRKRFRSDRRSESKRIACERSTTEAFRELE